MCLVPVAPACGTMCVCDMTHSYVTHYSFTCMCVSDVQYVTCVVLCGVLQWTHTTVLHCICFWCAVLVCSTSPVWCVAVETHYSVALYASLMCNASLVWYVAVNTHYSVALYMFLMCSTDVQYITCAVCCSGNTLQCCTVCVSDMQCITCVVCCSEHTLQCCTVYVSDVQYWCAVHHLCRLPVASVWDMTSLI